MVSFKQTFWRIGGFGKKKAGIGGLEYPYSLPPPPLLKAFAVFCVKVSRVHCHSRLGISVLALYRFSFMLLTMVHGKLMSSTQVLKQYFAKSPKLCNSSVHHCGYVNVLIEGSCFCCCFMFGGGGKVTFCVQS